MERWQRLERAFPKVEIITFGIVVEIGKEAHEHGKTKHKHQMEVGITVLTPIQPLQTAHDIIEKWAVVLLSPRGVIDKFGQEHADSYLIHVGLHRNVRRKRVELSDSKQAMVGPLRRIWVQHELEDQLPERIMWTREELDRLEVIGFENPRLVHRV